MRRRLLAVMASLALGGLAPMAARAADLEYFTGETLNADCAANGDAPDHAVRAARCIGYVLGASDAQQLSQAAGAPPRVCLPAGTDAARVVAAAKAYLAAHPERRRLAAQDLVRDALAAQFPCS